jgi:molybdenum cofactor cytidylyltransferase
MEAIVLAAGYSSRANAYKMLLPMGQMTVLEKTISNFEGLCSRVFVVAGFQAERIHAEMARITHRNVYSFIMKILIRECSLPFKRP